MSCKVMDDIAQCLRKINNTGGSDGLVGELLKYGGEGMVILLEKLFSSVILSVVSKVFCSQCLRND